MHYWKHCLCYAARHASLHYNASFSSQIWAVWKVHPQHHWIGSSKINVSSEFTHQWKLSVPSPPPYTSIPVEYAMILWSTGKVHVSKNQLHNHQDRINRLKRCHSQSWSYPSLDSSWKGLKSPLPQAATAVGLCLTPGGPVRPLSDKSRITGSDFCFLWGCKAWQAWPYRSSPEQASSHWKEGESFLSIYQDNGPRQQYP